METPGLLAAVNAAGASGSLTIVGSHIIRDQLAATPDPDRRGRLLATYDALPLQSVPTQGFVLGVSRLGEARLGDVKETRVSIDEARTRGRGGIQDALIATTASGEADVLVTEESDLARRVRDSRARCEVWSLAQFEAFVLPAIR